MAEHMWYERAQELETEIARLRAELAAEREAHRIARAELADDKRWHDDNQTEMDAISVVVGTNYLDPPDGGDVSLSEQVRRMKAELTAERERVAKLREALQRARNLMGPDEIIDAVLTETKGEENDTQ